MMLGLWLRLPQCQLGGDSAVEGFEPFGIGRIVNSIAETVESVGSIVPLRHSWWWKGTNVGTEVTS